ncbi:MAG: HAMP domain-containing sensor histidine kinase [Lachnospiraceae bacterium]|nr:HAMP domain-containing sensor histidine kinase [Lachnospiraceae bacterium]
MKQVNLRAMIAIRFALLVLTVIFLISVASNILIKRQFEKYVEEKQNTQTEELAQNLSSQYDDAKDKWNLDYIHGLGMYALNEGFIIKLYDSDENVLWDAENHDMTLCHQMMNTITFRMQEERPDLDGDFVTHRFDLKQNQKVVGFLDVSYYSPYYLNENDFQFITTLNHILVAVGIVSLIGAIIMGLILANNITEPIVKTSEIAQQISNGHYDIRFHSDVRAKELQNLTEAMNQMAGSLEEQENLRKRLTSDVAHELRTPIANVSSYLEAIIEGVWEATPERLQVCYDELDRISKLVSDLERLQQVENENLNLQKTEVDLLELTKGVVRNFETKISQKNIYCLVDGTHVIALVDERKMQQVVTNLLSNAIKYSNDYEGICILVEDTGEQVVIQVKDDGPGIAKEDQKWIFERFYRTDKSRNRKTGGAGIGLAIVKTIVQAHDGQVKVESEEGHGSKFVVILPKSEKPV